MLLFKYLLFSTLFCSLFILSTTDESLNEVENNESIEGGVEDGADEPLPSASYSARGIHKHRKGKGRGKSSSLNSKSNLKNSNILNKATNLKGSQNLKGKQQQNQYSVEQDLINNDYQPYIEENEQLTYTGENDGYQGSIFDSSPYSSEHDTGKLLQLQIITRRGDRTPFWLTKNDHYKEADFKEGINQQTKVGKRRIVDLGRVIRKRYSDFFDDLKPQDIIAEALQGPHAESTFALLAGLLPPIPEVEGQVWSARDPLARLWQPIAVHTTEKSRSFKLNTDYPCRAAEVIEKVNITRVPVLRRLLEDNRAFIKYLEEVTGEDFSPYGRGWMYIGYVLDTIKSEAGYFRENFKAPSWLDRKALNILEKFYDLLYRVFGNAPRYLKTRGGILLRYILDNMINTAVAGTGKPKVYIATTTDNGIAILKHAIGLFLGRPDFGATLLLELRQPRGRYSEASSVLGYGVSAFEEPTVHLFYVNTTNNFEVYPVPLQLSPRFYRLCPNYLHCSLTNFVVGLKDFVINGGEEEHTQLCNQV